MDPHMKDAAATVANVIRNAADPIGQIAWLIDQGVIPVCIIRPPVNASAPAPVRAEPGSRANLGPGLTVSQEPYPRGDKNPWSFSAYIRDPSDNVVAIVMRDGGGELWESLKLRAEMLAAAGDLAFALRAVMPYARSRLEDMTDEAENGFKPSAPSEIVAQAEADARRAGAAVDAAEAVLRRLGASIDPSEKR